MPELLFQLLAYFRTNRFPWNVCFIPSIWESSVECLLSVGLHAWLVVSVCCVLSYEHFQLEFLLLRFSWEPILECLLSTRLHAWRERKIWIFKCVLSREEPNLVNLRTKTLHLRTYVGESSNWNTLFKNLRCWTFERNHLIYEPLRWTFELKYFI